MILMETRGRVLVCWPAEEAEQVAAGSLQSALTQAKRSDSHSTEMVWGQT